MGIKSLLLDNPRTYRLIRPLIIRYYRHKARRIAEMHYRKWFGRDIDWEHPTEFNEKLRWLQFNTDTRIRSVLADKYRVRQYLTEKGFGHLLPELYGVWKNVKDIDFDALPDSFVMKGNNGSADVAIVKDKATIDPEELRDTFARSLLAVYGWDAAEPHYWDIPPRIIAEELLANDNDESSTIVDYKFHCFNGTPRMVKVYYNRKIKTHEAEFELFDMDWRHHPEWKDPTYPVETRAHFVKPALWEEMKAIAASLSKGHTYVRVDLYESGGRIYFGEFTFTPAACSGDALHPDFLNGQMADWLQLPKR